MVAVKTRFPLAALPGVAAALIAAGLVAAGLVASAQSAGVLGDWHTPAGSTIHIERCASTVCLRIAAVPPGIPITDIHNPDPALRNRAVCGLVIGSGFTLSDADHASGGTIYDPKNGKTYRGGMEMEGAELHLRGYVGIPLFGVSQTWTRVTQPVKPCSGQ